MVLCASVHEGSTPPRALSAFSDGMSLIFMGCAREEAPVPMLYANPMMSLTPRQVWHGAPSIGEATTSMLSWASQIRTSLNSTSRTWSTVLNHLSRLNSKPSTRSGASGGGHRQAACLSWSSTIGKGGN
jgi:hypothetical protein